MMQIESMDQRKITLRIEGQELYIGICLQKVFLIEIQKTMNKKMDIV
jgi:hypothetical protein